MEMIKKLWDYMALCRCVMGDIRNGPPDLPTPLWVQSNRLCIQPKRRMQTVARKRLSGLKLYARGLLKCVNKENEQWKLSRLSYK